MSTSPTTESDHGTETGPIGTTTALSESRPRPPLRRRLADSVADPVLRILATATLIATLSRGVFLTVTVLYLTLIVGLSAAEVALILGISSGIGVGTAYLGGRLADRFSARRMLLLFTIGIGLSLLGYPFVSTFSSALVVACLVCAFDRAANSTRMTVIARAFQGEARVHTRALLRTVTNLGIAAGSAVASTALLIGTADAYRLLMVAAACVSLLSVLQLAKLPSTVNAPRFGERPETMTGDGATDRTAARASRSPWRDPRYLALTALAGVFGIQFGLNEVGVPLWIVQETTAPTVLVAAALIVNTIIVIALQIPLSRGTHDVHRAGRVIAIAGALMVFACVGYALAGGTGVVMAIVLILVASIAHALAEVLSQAGTWGLSFELADPAHAGAYQGVFAMGFSLGAMIAPSIVAATALAHGAPGWAILAALFLASAGGLWLIARRAGQIPLRESAA